MSKKVYVASTQFKNLAIGKVQLAINMVYLCIIQLLSMVLANCYLQTANLEFTT